MSVRKGDLLKPRLRVLTCGTLACTKVASMDPKWHHMGLEKAPSLRMESVQEIFTRAATPCGEISVCLQPRRICPTSGCLWAEA